MNCLEMVSTAHDTALQRRFIALWRSCSTDDDAASAAVWRQISRHYAEPHRRYHGLAHIAFCLEQLDLAAGLMESAQAVELAVWFHDAVYRPGDPDNEAASAALFRDHASSVDPALVESVASLILDTTHLAVPKTEDGRYMVDIDLASLGLPWPRFLRDSEAIREEQPDVPDVAYTSAQQSFLKGLLARPALYRTRFFQDRCEAVARSNIERTLDGRGA